MALFRMKPHYRKSGGTLSKYGITYLHDGRSMLAATSVGDYAIFAGGNNSTLLNSVDLYTTDLTHLPISNSPNISPATDSLAATSVGDYAIFAGGTRSSGLSSITHAYDKSLTSSLPATLSQARKWLAATSVGDYAIFAGGCYNAYYGSASNIVNAYNTSLTYFIPTELSNSRYHLGAATVGNYALFGGGYAVSNIYYDTVDVYDNSLTRITLITLQYSSAGVVGTSIKNYALFCCPDSTYYANYMNAYNASLTRFTPQRLSKGRSSLAATAVGNYALFGGGFDEYHNTKLDDTVDVYNASLVRTVADSLSQARGELAATTIGNFALFGGGREINSRGNAIYYNIVDVYQVT